MLDLINYKEKKFLLNSNMVLRNVGNKYWVLDTRLGNQYRLNNISYNILNLFREKKSITDVLELIADEYNVNIEKLFCDSSTMLNFAIEKNVIEEMVE